MSVSLDFKIFGLIFIILFLVNIVGIYFVYKLDFSGFDDDYKPVSINNLTLSGFNLKEEEDEEEEKEEVEEEEKEEEKEEEENKTEIYGYL